MAVQRTGSFEKNRMRSFYSYFVEIKRVVKKKVIVASARPPMAKCSTTGVSWPVVMMAISVTTVSARFNVSFTMAQRVKARLHDATFVQNIIGSLLKNVLDQKLYRVDAR